MFRFSISMPAVLLASALASINVALADDIGFEDPRDLTSPQMQRESAADDFELRAGVEHQIDDNLFRLPSQGGLPLQTTGSSIVSRADHRDIISAGIDGQQSWNTQTIKFDAQVDDNLFVRNTDFSGVTGKGQLDLDWTAGPLLTGEAGVSYNRFIPGFQDTLFYDRDFFSTVQYFLKGQFQASPHWTASAGLSRSKNSYSNDSLKGDDFSTTTGTVGVHYFTLAEDWIGVDYLYEKSQFDSSALFGTLAYNPDYLENSERLAAQYSFTSKLKLNADVGYKSHDTQDAGFATFSGDVWRASLRWQPLTKTQVTIDGWRDITAYLDAQSAFFVSTGYSIAPYWTPRDKITLSLFLSHEKHDFLGGGSNSLPPLADLPSRQDKLTTERVTLAYRPRTAVTLKLSYAYEHRSSNIEQFSYNDNLADLGLMLTF